MLIRFLFLFFTFLFIELLNALKPKDKSQKEKDNDSAGVSSGAPKLSEEEEHQRLLDYFSANETLLGEMSILEGFDAMEVFIKFF